MAIKRQANLATSFPTLHIIIVRFVAFTTTTTAAAAGADVDVDAALCARAI